MSVLDDLIRVIDPARQVVIQAHDFPDHDAVAAGYALMRLLQTRGLEPQFCFSGTIQSSSLTEAISTFKIPIVADEEAKINPQTQLILVDGFVGNRNVTELEGEVIGLIDHHSPPERPTCAFWDIREDYGSCSTILYTYFVEENEDIDVTTATVLLMGLMMDTGFMTRGVRPIDLEAFSKLFFKGDWEAGSRLLKNSLALADLAVFREAINACEVAGDFCFVLVNKECSPEVMALTADFFLNLKEINFVVVLVPDRDEYRLSVRSSDIHRPSDVIIRRALRGIGYGGGHVHMGGGSIPRDLYPGEQTIRNRFLKAMGRE